MSPVDFTITTRQMECSFTISENGLLACILEDRNEIQKQTTNVSFLFIDPDIRYQSSLFFTDLDEPDKKSVNFTYDFTTPVTCRVLGNDTTTIKCGDRL